jgi:glycerol-3-phosphate responsive antiterminator
MVKVDLQKESKVDVNGTMHFQFSTILSCKVLVIVQGTKEKKRSKRTVHVDFIDGSVKKNLLRMKTSRLRRGLVMIKLDVDYL